MNSARGFQFLQILASTYFLAFVLFLIVIMLMDVWCWIIILILGTTVKYTACVPPTFSLYASQGIIPQATGPEAV